MRNERGFTFLLVLFLVAITGAGLAVASDYWATTRQREREAELLDAGEAIRLAIQRYYQATPGLAKQLPPQLEDLLKDPRFPDTRRHLRQLYPDPFTGAPDWVLIKHPTGGIMGVASGSELAPIKRAGFLGYARVFETVALERQDKLRYRDWEFIYQPPVHSGTGQGGIPGGGF